MFVPLDQWSLPTTSVHRTLRDAISSFLERARQTAWLAESDEEGGDALRPLSRRQLSRWAPPADWQSGLVGMTDALDNWWERWGTVQTVAFLVAPPFSGIGESLEQLCRERGWRLIEPPDDRAIHRTDAVSWWSQFDGETTWVLPELGHCWLRTPAGLTLVRRLLGAIAAGELGQGVIGCSSWTWQFWRHLMPELRFSVMTPQAYDHVRLGRWLGDLAQEPSSHFRLTTNGSWVVPPKAAGEQQNHKTSAFLRDLAAWSRGIPEVAWSTWRQALRAQPEAEVVEGTAGTTPVRHESTCWVVPWDQLTLPSLPPGESRPLAFVLHALLMHQGLDEEHLRQTTGLDLDDIHISLHSLRRAELVEPHPRGWFVTARGYPAIRRYLQTEGFAVDGF
ncbi:B3/4 domain-containing protein [Marinobacter nanhaiticus D15-8W]|uniref:Uncharacterized protein n=1 Tax=Marinobacter nanhaiticus D15-8W TaxID=626887 RepID=N6VSP0_9GAMM|nr:hypothetical protein J057_17255 [Marinobacter nanhaiticus D15-8W]BES70525.1 B3/4 domain-containing protein [Marinobacter nanhaiticus D15-8W]